MRKIENVYGKGNLYGEQDIPGMMWVQCSACMNIYSEFLSWANDKRNVTRFVSAEDARSITILGCALNDLSIYNSLNLLNFVMKQHPDKDFYIGGCLAKRFDLYLPDGVRRLDILKNNQQQILNKNLINWSDPYQVEQFDENTILKMDTSKYRFLYTEGNLFRDSYPLRIGGGCPHKCSVGGGSYELPFDEDKFTEFISSKKPVLIGGEISMSQARDWIFTSMDQKRSISLRNINPIVFMDLLGYLEMLSEKGFLNVLHINAFSTNEDALNDAGYDPYAVKELLKSLKFIKRFNTVLATTITTNYKTFPDTPSSDLIDFDYVTSIPQQDEVYDPDVAKQRWMDAFPQN